MCKILDGFEIDFNINSPHPTPLAKGAPGWVWDFYWLPIRFDQDAGLVLVLTLVRSRTMTSLFSAWQKFKTRKDTWHATATLHILSLCKTKVLWSQMLPYLTICQIGKCAHDVCTILDGFEINFYINSPHLILLTKSAPPLFELSNLTTCCCQYSFESQCCCIGFVVMGCEERFIVVLCLEFVKKTWRWAFSVRHCEKIVQPVFEFNTGRCHWTIIQLAWSCSPVFAQVHLHCCSRP